MTTTNPQALVELTANELRHCIGTREISPVELLDASLPGKLIKDLNPERWEVRSFLNDSGIAEKLPDNAEDRARALAGVVALK